MRIEVRQDYVVQYKIKEEGILKNSEQPSEAYPRDKNQMVGEKVKELQTAADKKM